MTPALRTVALLLCSNVFMTAAWYGHLRFHDARVLPVILVSWGLAFFEYALQVPANRLGYGTFTAYQLKILQEVIALAVFMVFAAVWLGEPVQLRQLLAFALIVAAVAVGFS